MHKLEQKKWMGGTGLGGGNERRVNEQLTVVGN